VIVKGGEVIARLEDDILIVAELHCEEFAMVGYALLALAA
jgi:hypothetical protein